MSPSLTKSSLRLLAATTVLPVVDAWTQTVYCDEYGNCSSNNSFPWWAWLIIAFFFLGVSITIIVLRIKCRQAAIRRLAEQQAEIAARSAANAVLLQNQNLQQQKAAEHAQAEAARKSAGQHKQQAAASVQSQQYVAVPVGQQAPSPIPEQQFAGANTNYDTNVQQYGLA